MAKGALSVDTEHLFPIIKKWLYSEKDIFVREVISNACDAITKHKRLISLGQTDDDNTQYRITVSVDKEEKTLTVTDNGIGMNSSEVERYINNIALSGAMEFISKYENDSSSGIIGHFGLGFYSMFIVAETVTMKTRSYLGGEGVCWECDSDGNFESTKCDFDGHGTEIVMHLSEDEASYLDTKKLKSILERYCSFMPYDIVLAAEGKEEQINDTNPLWQRNPSDVSDDDYNQFYKKVFEDFEDPLFRVHIVADYPLNFKGVLFIPKRKPGYDSAESEIKLFYNSVFVADNIKEAIPDFLVNFKGVLDCPELPLNVSRSYLQNDVYVRKIASHIAKKVADRFNTMFANTRDELENNWIHLKPYLEYACMRDDKFGDRIRSNMLFEKSSGGFCTTEEYLGGTEGEILYTTDRDAQSYYISIFADKGKEVLVLDNVIDSNFVQYLESKNDKLKFRRIDSGFETQNDTDGSEKLISLFKKALNKEDMSIEFVSLGENGAAALVSVDEESRRLADMMRMYSVQSGNESFSIPISERLVINPDNPIIKKLATAEDDSFSMDKAKHTYLCALLLSRRLTPDESKEFVELNNRLI